MANSDDTPAKRIGPWLRAARIKRDTTEAELARALETEQSMIAMIERGEAQPSPALEAKIRAWIRSGHHEGPRPARGPYRK